MISLLVALSMIPTDSGRVAYKFVGEKYVRSIEGSELLAQALDAETSIEFAVLDEVFEHQAVRAWQTETIGSHLVVNASDGAGVTVAVLDSGIDADHPDLTPQAVSGWNFIMGSDATDDDNGHGTSVAGCVFVVAPKARLMPVKVAGSNGSAYSSTLYNGLVWAADHGARVANMSYMVTSSSLVKSGMAYFRSKGGICTVAAGNYNSRDNNPDNPDCLTVSATDSKDAKASWSNYGTTVDVCAPGVGVYSTTRGGWGSVSGTSFSAPTVAGLVALVASKSDDPQGLLKRTAKDLGASGWDEVFGHGRIQAVPAVASFAAIPPVLSVEAPLDGAVVVDTLRIKASALDDQKIDRLKLYVNGLMYRTIMGDKCDVVWTVGHWPKRTYRITVQAVDKEGKDTKRHLEVVKN